MHPFTILNRWRGDDATSTSLCSSRHCLVDSLIGSALLLNIVQLPTNAKCVKPIIRTSSADKASYPSLPSPIGLSKLLPLADLTNITYAIARVLLFSIPDARFFQIFHALLRGEEWIRVAKYRNSTVSSRCTQPDVVQATTGLGEVASIR